MTKRMEKTMSSKEEPASEYRLSVYKDHAIINGFVTSDVLKRLVKVCERHGFTHLVPHSKPGFKLVKIEKNDEETR